MEKTLVAKWESKSGKHFAELWRDAYGYSYKGVDCGGNLGTLKEAEAIEVLEMRVLTGYFQPDANTTPMKRIR